MNRKSKVFIAVFGAVLLIGLFVHGCDALESQTISYRNPLADADFRSFWMLKWVTSPDQEINVHLKKNADTKQLLDSRLFGEIEPEMTDAAVLAKFGKPALMRNDPFGGSWSRYLTELGYVEVGLDRRTSPLDDDDSPIPGRHSLRAFTERSYQDVFCPALVAVLRDAEKISRRPDWRELSVFDSDHNLILNVWLRGGRIDHVEVFRNLGAQN